MSHADEYQSEPTVGTPGSGERVSCRPLVIAFTSTTSFVSMVEIVGGAPTNSLAMLAEVGQLATDAALDRSLFGVWLARRPATLAHSFGSWAIGRSRRRLFGRTPGSDW
jgi:Co/Zn/Cd efflux system component